MSTTDVINYARDSGIYKSELAGAIIFAVIYALLFAYNAVRSMRHPTYVLVVLAFFCLIRVVAFTLRSVLAGDATAGQNIHLFIAEQIIYSVGFFGLLYSAYTLVLDRELIAVGPSGRQTPDGIIGLVSRVMRNRHLIRLALLAAVGLGIAAGVQSSETSTSAQNSAVTLRRASVYIFLVVSIMLVLVTARLAFEEELSGRDDDGPIGRKHRLILLLAIALLCVTREAFFAATSKNTKQQNNAHLWYPLAALTELVAVLLFAVLYLVPSRAEISKDLGLVPQEPDQWGTQEKLVGEPIAMPALRHSETRPGPV
ncbi:hypothetical protein NM688_g2668 [Phlebia brevispora]|uniref:Uncharacterized protein n=1 Tax=Phlebia brevispora TaxID=194682 RepID=A0ACC1T7Y6_9APHY|nr:hypothetical protein NM688_g2668 [Phlebia brevispora]